LLLFSNIFCATLERKQGHDFFALRFSLCASRAFYRVPARVGFGGFSWRGLLRVVRLGLLLRRGNAMNADQFRNACDALGGQSETARALGIPFRAIRHYCARDDIARPIPEDLPPRIAKLLRARAKQLERMARELT
jgi:hypothetical protein